MLRRSCSLSLVVVVVVVAAGCGDAAEPIADASVTRATCSFALPSDARAVRAHDAGLVIAHDGVVHRTRGKACDLEASGAPVAGELLDVDNHGALYVFPAEAAEEGHIATVTLPSFGSTVARVEAGASSTAGVTKLVYAARGIWNFAAAPDGDALWMFACGPNGVFDVTPPASVTESVLEAPTVALDTLPVFTSRDTLWSVGSWTCDPTVQSPSDPAQLSEACGFALVRTTPEGSADVASTVMDFGAGLGNERGALARCGANVCGVFTSAVVRWNDDGEVIEVLNRAAMDVRSGERIAGATGNAHGLYVHIVKGEDGSESGRVAFIPHAG